MEDGFLKVIAPSTTRRPPDGAGIKAGDTTIQSSR